MTSTVCRSRKLLGQLFELSPSFVLAGKESSCRQLPSANRIDPIRDGSNREESRNGDRGSGIGIGIGIATPILFPLLFVFFG